MPELKKYFTLEEARAELPRLKRRFGRIRKLIPLLKDAHVEIARVNKLLRGNGHAAERPDVEAELTELRRLVSAILDRGIEIKDLERGLVDFPHMRGDQEVYLCWQYGEKDVLYWHSLDGGFAGRAPL